MFLVVFGVECVFGVFDVVFVVKVGKVFVMVEVVVFGRDVG